MDTRFTSINDSADTIRLYSSSSILISLLQISKFFFFCFFSNIDQEYAITVIVSEDHWKVMDLNSGPIQIDLSSNIPSTNRLPSRQVQGRKN